MVETEWCENGDIKPTLLQAHLQFTRANAQTKNCKRAYNANADRKKNWQTLKRNRNEESPAGNKGYKK